MRRVSINSIRIKNYRSIKDSKKIEFKDKVTVFAGKNESGKTNILKAIETFYEDNFSEDDVPVNDKESNPEIRISFQMTKEYVIEKIGEKITLDKDTYSLIITRSMKYKDVYEGSVLDIIKIAYKNKCYQNEEVKSLVTDDMINKIFKKLLEISKDNYDEEIKKLLKDLPESDIDNVSILLRDIWNQINPIKLINSLIPQIAYFNSFEDVLPDEISEEELTAEDFETKNRVFINLLKILGMSKEDFLKKVKGNTRNQSSEFKKLSKTITEKYNLIYSQEDISIELDKNGDKVYIQIFDNGDSQNDKKPSQRSKGFQWFIAFYLLLNSLNEDAIILIDEPGLYLHAKAQEDILKFLNDEVSNIVLFTTHSPYLIDINKLNSLNLVKKDDKNGTTISQKYYECSDQDTMTPLITAIGYNVSKNPIELGQGLNIITEGISDRFYLLSFLKLLNIDKKVNVIPSIGSGNIHLLVSLAIGWGLEYKILLDDDKGGIDAIESLKQLYSSEQELLSKVVYSAKKGAIENVFSTADKSKHHISSNKKVVSAFNFYEKTNKGEINVKDFEKETINNIKEIIDSLNL